MSSKALVSHRQVTPEVADDEFVDVGAGIVAAGNTLTIGDASTTVEIPGEVTFGATQTKTIQTRSVTITHVTLNAAALSQAINIGAVLPANAMILGANVAIATPTTGGSATSCTVDIGTSGDVDALIDGADVFAAAVDGMASTHPLGIAPNKLFVTAGAQLIATVTSDVNVSLLTAGSFTVTVAFAAL